MITTDKFMFLLSDVLSRPMPAWVLAAALFLLIAGLLFLYSRRLKRTVAEPSAAGNEAPAWHTMPVEQLLQRLSSAQTEGLDQAEATERLKRYGPNKLAEKPPKPAWLLLLAQFKSLLIVVLLAAALLAAAVGDITDGAVILVVVIINALLGFYQEYQAEQSLAALKKMLALNAEVRRDGRNRNLPVEQIVPGDIVILDAGDKIPADGRIITAQTLEVDESSLTGESIPVAKQTQPLPEHLPLAERNNMLYMNNAVTRGRAEMIVAATGMHTEIGRLAGLLAQTEDGETPLQIQLDGLGKRLALIALIVIIGLFMSALSRGEPLIETAFTAIALAVAAIPEGLPAVVTVTLALGMHRLARQRAIIKRLAAVETLGCTTVICTDKTGTLTVNRMTARSVFYQGRTYHISGEGYELAGTISTEDGRTEDLSKLLLPLALCNNSHLHDGQVVGDPMEGALLVLAAKGGIGKKEAHAQLPRLVELPFDAEHKFMATFHRDGDHVKIFVKGAPEVILGRCTAMLDAGGQTAPLDKEGLLGINKTMAGTGLRVLAVAERTLPSDRFAADHDLFHYMAELTFVALIGLMDPPRPEARDAIRLCRQAGIEVKMITGDQKVTASAIARELELTGDVIEGGELADINDEALAARIDKVSVFARTAPEQKVRIVRALKADGHVVAMTGDGVNDTPALKNADIGIAMGITGTDVAKEAATMVLTDDNFATIVKAVKEGRGIYDNMIKFVRFQLSTNIGAILSVASAPLLGLPVPFTAVQLLWINIIMDGPPAMALGVDPARPGSMTEAPRNPGAPILSLRRLGNLFSYGLTMAAGTLAVFYCYRQNGLKESAATLAFTTFVLFQVFNVFNARAERITTFNQHFFANRMLWLALFSVVLLQIVAVHWPPAQAVFHTAALRPTDWLVAVAVASSVLLLEEVRKFLLFMGQWLRVKK